MSAATAAPPLSAEDIETARDLGTALSRLLRGVVQLKASMSGEWSAFAVLTRLIEEGPQRSSGLAEAMHVDPSRMSRLVAHLIDKQYLVRRADPADGRASILAITSAGRRAHQRMQRTSDERLARTLADWPAHDRRQLATLLDRLATDLTTHKEKA